MTPTVEASYFPALDKCLNGELPLISWETAYTALCDSLEGNDNSVLEHFLRDESVKSILTQPLEPFPHPSPKTKSDFETKTAAINVLPSNNGQYDINRLKSDAQWLSKEANIDEISALRLAIVEWQQRATTRLVTEWSEEDGLTSLKTTGDGGFNAPTPLSAGASADTGKPFDTDKERRKRLLNVLFTERTFVLKLSETLIGFAQPLDLQPPAYSQTEPSKSGTDHTPPWLRNAARFLWNVQQNLDADRGGKGFFVECTAAIRTRLDMLGDSSKWPETVSSDAELSLAYPKSLTVETVAVLRLALLHANSMTTLAPSEYVKAWFDLMDQYTFLVDIPLDHHEADDLIVIIRCLVSLTSTSLLQVSLSLEYLQNTYSRGGKVSYPSIATGPYLENEDCARLLTSSLLGAAAQTIRHASPAVLAWSIIAQNLREIANVGGNDSQRNVDDESSDTESPLPRRTSFREPRTKQTKSAILLDMILDVTPGEDSITMMGNGAVIELRVFEVVSSIADALLLAFGALPDIHTVICGRLILFRLLRDGLPLIQYGSDVVQSVLSVISYDANSLLGWPSEPAKSLLNDNEVMGPLFMEQVVSRYPYEQSPFLVSLGALSRSISSVDENGSRISQLLDNMTTFTCTLPTHFDAYDLVREDEMTNCIRLTQDLAVFDSSKRQSAGLLMNSSDHERNGNSHAIPTGTVGIVLNDTRPFVVCWQYQHSTLEYLGVLLSTRTSNATISDSSTSSPVDQETAADIIGLINSLAESTASAGNVEDSRQLLGRLSFGLQRNDDIIRVILEIFEQELQLQMDHPGMDRSILLLVKCVRFMVATLQVYPERIWSFLVRSRFLAVTENYSAFAAIVGATEVPLAQYAFLRSCTHLFEGLVEDAVKRAVSRKHSTKAVTRFEERIPLPGATPEKMMTTTLLTFERIVVDIFQSQASWRFVDAIEKIEINTRIIKVFNSVLQYTYAIDDSEVLSTKLTGFFAPISGALLEVFLAQKSQGVILQPLLDGFAIAVSELGASSTLRSTKALISQTTAGLAFSTTLLKVSLLSGRQGGQLLKELYMDMPVLAKLYAVHASFRPCVAELLTVMVQNANTDGKEPASILSHLSPGATKAFLSVISHLDYPLQNLETEVKIWDMLSAVVSNKQQWLAICLLTGSTPRDRLKSKSGDAVASQERPLLTQALDALSKIATISPRRAIAILTFVSLAQKHWSWATNDIGKHTDFITKVSDWLSELTPNTRPSDPEAATRHANETQMAAYVADILATYLHSIRQRGNADVAKAIAPKLQYLRDNAVAVDGYNHSLHKNLARNFVQKFPTCTLPNFKRTALCPADFGRNYYYNTGLASRMLDFESSWSRGKNQGFVDEVGRANINLSVVESQISLLKSWKGLAIELSNYAHHDQQIQRDLAVVVEGCLKANMDTSVPAALFENVSQVRAELAFVLLQKFVNIKSKEPKVRELAHVAWDTVRTSGLNFEIATTPQDAEYYRILLRTLFLALQPQVFNPPSSTSLRKTMSTTTSASPNENSPALTPLLLEILRKVIAANFRALCSSVHADPQSIAPSDFVLLTALLQTILRIPGTTAIYSQIGTIVSDSSLIRYATSLYTWSDALADPSTSDPIYGEIGILFLLSLSSIPILANQMAVEGTLSHISAANISTYLRKNGGKGPFDSPHRMHDIWTRGILPLCLNMLEAVGAPIAAEIAGFLNSFPAQLARAGRDLENTTPTTRNPHAGSITLGLAIEMHELSLIARVLLRLREMGPAAGLAGNGIQELVLGGFETAAVREEVQSALRSRRALRERIAPVGEREGEWARMKAETTGSAGDAESKLEERIVGELEAALECLNA